jgi:antitoxin ParD1/3/4
MTKLSIELPAGLSEWVEARVDSGLYADEGDYIRDLVRQDLNAGSDLARQEQLEEKIAEGLADIEAGRVYDAEEVFAEIHAMIDAAEAKQAAE